MCKSKFLLVELLLFHGMGVVKLFLLLWFEKKLDLTHGNYCIDDDNICCFVQILVIFSFDLHNQRISKVDLNAISSQSPTRLQFFSHHHV